PLPPHAPSTIAIVSADKLAPSREPSQGEQPNGDFRSLSGCSGKFMIPAGHDWGTATRRLPAGGSENFANCHKREPRQFHISGSKAVAFSRENAANMARNFASRATADQINLSAVTLRSKRSSCRRGIVVTAVSFTKLGFHPVFGQRHGMSLEKERHQITASQVYLTPATND